MRLPIFCMTLWLILTPCLISASEAEEMVEVTVVKKDTLSHICKTYFGDPNQWRRIARINRLKNPDLIFPGQVLKVPVEILKGTPIDGVVTFVKGDAAAKESAREEWRVLHVNDHVNEGSALRTGDESGLEISFEDGTAFLMRANTNLEIKTAQKGIVHFMHRLYLQGGRIISRIKAATGRTMRYEVHTPSAMAAARGTEYRVWVDPDSATRSEVLQGSVDVSAQGRSVSLHDEEGTVVRPNKPPSPPSKLLSPPEPVGLEPLYRAMPLTFRFGNVEGAFAYRVMLTRDEDAKDVVKEKVITPDQTLGIVGVDDGAYYLRSLTINNEGLEGRFSEPRAVTVRVNPLPPFVSAPVNDAKLRTRSFAIQWLKVRDAADYHLQIAEDAGFSNVVLDKTGIKDTSFQTGELKYGPYFLRVSSVAEDGYEGIWSVAQGFAIIPPPPTPPVEEPKMDEKGITLRWGSLGENIVYQVQMSRDEGFKEILFDGKVKKPEITLERPGKSGTYYVRVRGIDADEYAGSFSKPQSFEIKKRFPYEFLGAVGALGIIFFIIF
jgi:LysM repeat protein